MNIAGPRSNVAASLLVTTKRRSSCIEKGIKMNLVLPLGGRKITIQIKKFAKCQRLWGRQGLMSHLLAFPIQNRLSRLTGRLSPVCMNSTPRSTKHSLRRIQGLFIFLIQIWYKQDVTCCKY